MDGRPALPTVPNDVEGQVAGAANGVSTSLDTNGGGSNSAPAALAAAAARFAFSATPRLDAELLLAHALGIDRDRLLLDPDRWTVPAAFADLVERRAAHEPVAYITGTRGFWTLDLAVGPGALVPRVDSETLVEAALAHFAGRPPATLRS